MRGGRSKSADQALSENCEETGAADSTGAVMNCAYTKVGKKPGVAEQHWHTWQSPQLSSVQQSSQEPKWATPPISIIAAIMSSPAGHHRFLNILYYTTISEISKANFGGLKGPYCAIPMYGWSIGIAADTPARLFHENHLLRRRVVAADELIEVHTGRNFFSRFVGTVPLKLESTRTKCTLGPLSNSLAQ